jgi:hypothetical protein
VEGGMSVRRSGLTPALIGILALVVLAQAAVLFFLLVVPPEKDPILGPLRESRLVTRVIEICRPATV